MKKVLLAVAALLLSAAPTLAQTPSTVRIQQGSSLVGSGNPLYVTGSFTPSGTQNVNLTQILGAAPSLTNYLWVFPATGATWAATLPTTPTVAAGNGVIPAPSSEALAAIAHSASVTAAESCRVLKASAGNLYSLRVSIAATTGYIMVFDATSAPVDGAVTTLAIPAVRVVSDGTSGWYADSFNPPMRMATGITVCFSSTGPFTKTASATAAISGQTQ